MAIKWSTKLEDRFCVAFATPGFYRKSKHVGDAGVELDFDIIFREPTFCRLAVQLLSEKVKAWAAKERVDYMAFLEKPANTTSAITLAGALSIDTGIPHLVIRLHKDIPHERIKFPEEAGAAPLKDAKVVLITDYANTGRELQPAVRAVVNLGGKVAAVVVLVWVEEQFNKNREMTEVGISDEMLSLIIPASEVEEICRRDSGEGEKEP